MARWLSVFAAGVLVLVGFWLSGNRVTVTRIIDGDTVEIADGRHVRYIGVDAPEKENCFATAAAKLNEDLVLGKKVRLEFGENEIDDYGRTLAFVWLNGQLVNEILLQNGVGEFYFDELNGDYNDRLIQAAIEAHDQLAGLWSECAVDKAAGCNIKANLDIKDKHWYHLPSFRHYNQVVVNLDHGDRWFCSETEAQAAGFVRARE